MKKTKPHIVLGVTGSIAAYKAAELVRLMVTRDWEVSVIMTKAATRFVGELTFRTLSRNPVAVDMFDMPELWQPGHIDLASRADVFIVAPCTANVIAKLANGLADDLLSCVALATRAPLVVAPAMNENMWEHPATRANVARLVERGAVVVDVGAGDLACGITGRGRLAAVETIVASIEPCLKKREAEEKK
jgi:phosphopantothenoylcysteine synthetase/decarboxylase